MRSKIVPRPAGHLDRLAMLRDRHLREAVVLDALQPGRAAEGDDEEEAEGDEQQADPAVRAPVPHFAPSRTYVVVNGSAG